MAGKNQIKEVACFCMAPLDIYEVLEYLELKATEPVQHVLQHRLPWGRLQLPDGAGCWGPLHQLSVFDQRQTVDEATCDTPALGAPRRVMLFEL